MRIDIWTLIRVAPLIILAAVIWYFYQPSDSEEPLSTQFDLDIQAFQNGAETSQQSDAPTIANLIRQLHLAEVMGRVDLVASNLKRLEAIAPGNLEAAFFRAYLQLAEGDIEQARKTYLQMEFQAPEATETRQLKHYIDSFDVNKEALQHAQLLATAGRYPEAVEEYRQLFPDGMPTLRLRLEYLNTKGQIDGLWKQTRVALEDLNQAFPDFPVLELALADHITRRYPEDRWSLALYRRLANGAGLGRQAAASWLRSLARRDVNTRTLEEYALLASRYPADLDIQESYRRSLKEVADERERMKDPHYRAQMEGLAHLQAGRLGQAESRLRYAMQARSNDEDVVGGLGMVYLRRGEQSRALPYFKLALEHNRNPDLVSKWQGLVDTSRYWAWVKQADQDMQNGYDERAELLLNQALALKPMVARAYVLRGDLAVKQKRYGLADQYYRQALDRDPLDASALWARVTLVERQQGRRAALAMIDRYSPAQQAKIVDRRRKMASEQQLAALNEALRSGDRTSLLRAVEKALQTPPDSPWQKADIADMLVSLGHGARADRLMANWTAARPEPDVRFAYALYLSRRNAPEAAIAQLQNIPPAQRSDAMERNLLRLQIASELGSGKQDLLARPELLKTRLADMEKRYRDDPDAMLRIAEVWLDADRSDQASRVIDGLTPAADWRFSTRLNYGDVLLRLARLDAFQQWQTSYSEVGLSEGERQQRSQQKGRYLLARAQAFEAQNKDLVAYSMYHQATVISGGHQLEARLGVLRSSRRLGYEQAYDEQAEVLLAGSDSLSTTALVQLAGALDESGDAPFRDQALSKLKNRDDASALNLRDAMLMAERAEQWQHAEEFAYLALAKDAGSEQKKRKQLYQSAADNWLTRSVKSRIDKYRDRHDGHIIVGLDHSVREGREKNTQVPIEARIPVPQLDGHLLLRMDTVSLNSGKVSYLDPDPANPGALQRISFSEKATGVAAGVGWQAENWWADIGSTPIGLRESTWVGGVGMRGSLSTVGWRLDLSRRPEVGTSLSYGGMKVPETAAAGAGQEWGGVVRSGAKLGLSYDKGGALGYWSSLQFHQLTGDGVEDNQRIALLAGTYWRVLEEANQQVRLGVNVTHLQYDKNLEEFTLGHGGYYSPQNYFSLSFPVRYFGRSGTKWSYMFGASVSQSVKEEDAPYKLGGNASNGGGFGYALEAAIERRIARRWYLGLSADIQRADFYEPNHVILYLRYTFQDRWQPIPTPPEPPILYSSFD